MLKIIIPLRKHSTYLYILSIVALIFFFYFTSSQKNTNNHYLINKQKVHIGYTHYIYTADATTIDNFKFFMKHAYLPCDEQTHFTIIINQNDISNDVFFSISFHLDVNLLNELKRCSSGGPGSNTHVINRLNKEGSDLCAYVELLQSEYWKNIVGFFKYFMFFNSSVRGPFLPNYWLKTW